MGNKAPGNNLSSDHASLANSKLESFHQVDNNSGPEQPMVEKFKVTKNTPDHNIEYPSGANSHS